MTNMKKCSTCGEVKNITEFNKNKSTKDGLQKQCKSCRKTQQKKYYSSHKSDVIKRAKEHRSHTMAKWNKFKSKLECQVCGENHPPCLEFHHLDPSEKDFEISQKCRDMTFEKILKEVEKCAILCANCHRKVHSGLICL